MHQKRFHDKLGEDYVLFKLACPHYDLMEHMTGEVIKGKYRRSLVEEIQVLEIGCGTGITTKVLLKADPRIKVTALDNESVMIEQAKKELMCYVPKGRVNFVQADALDFLRHTNLMPDVFVSAFTLHNFENSQRKELIKRVYGLLNRDGLFVNTDKYALDDKTGHEKELDWQLKKFDVFDSVGRPDLKESWIKHYFEDESSGKIMREGEFKQIMYEEGFRGIETVHREHMDAIVIGHKN